MFCKSPRPASFAGFCYPHPYPAIRLLAWYNGGMLTEKRLAEMNNLWRKRVLAGKYLTDIPMQRLTPSELIVLATDSLYEKANKHRTPNRLRCTKTNKSLQSLPQSVKEVYMRHFTQYETTR
jgi:hypothetical protein